jgi:hypothetical protein
MKQLLEAFPRLLASNKSLYYTQGEMILFYLFLLLISIALIGIILV